MTIGDLFKVGIALFFAYWGLKSIIPGIILLIAMPFIENSDKKNIIGCGGCFNLVVGAFCLFIGLKIAGL